MTDPTAARRPLTARSGLLRKAAVVIPDVIISSLLWLDIIAALPTAFGLGLMLAADYNGGEVKDFVKKLLKNGLVALSCGENALRLVPPLVLTKKQAQEGLSIIKATLDDIK